MQIYKNTGSNFMKFANETYTSFVRYASFSKDKTYLAVSTDSGVHLYKNPTGASLVEESSVSGKETHKVSDNNKYLVTGLNGEAKVYVNSEF